MSKTNAAEDLVGNWLYTTGSPIRPTAWYVSLHTADPGEAGTGTEVSTSGTAYARQSATFAAFSGGTSSNTGLLTYPTATANWGTVTHAAVWTAVTGGTCLSSGALTTGSGAVNTGTTYTIAIGAVILTED